MYNFLNSKSEARNSKQIRNSNFQNSKQFWPFSIVSKFKIQNSKFCRRQDGYIALIALLIVAAAGLTIGIAVSLEGMDEVQASFSHSQAAKAKSLANGCIEDGLERLRNNWVNYSGSLSIDGNSCIINIVINGSNATINATGTVDIYNQKIQIQVDDTLAVMVWQEE